jgi:hypothetical protein
MALTTAQLATLKNELLTDPKAYGYVQVPPLNSQAIADLLNLVRAGEQVAQTILKSSDIFQAVVASEWAATMTTLARFQYFDALMATGSGQGHIDLSNGNVKAALDLIFPAATCPLTNAAHHALYLRNGSRAETLFGPQFALTGDDVSHAQQS